MSDLGSFEGAVPVTAETRPAPPVADSITFTVPISPDCLAGKHQACWGDAWDNARDRSVLCACDECAHGGDAA